MGLPLRCGGRLAVPLLLVAVLFAVACANDEPNDNSLRASDTELQSLDDKMKSLEQQEEEMRRQRAAVTRKLDMIRRVQRARSLLQIRQIEVSDAHRELDSQKKVRDSAEEGLRSKVTEKENTVLQKKQAELAVLEQNSKVMSADQRRAALEKIEKATAQQQKWMEQEKDNALQKLKELGEDFKRKGLAQWIKYNSESLPTVVKGTVDKMAPIITRVDQAVEANSHVTEVFMQRLGDLLPQIKKSPFYEGILFYILLLIPTVITAWLLLKVHARLSQLSVAHYVVAMNLYFGAMSILCLFMSLLSRNDILIVFRHRSKTTLELFMLLHALLFVVLLTLHAVISYVSKTSKDFGQLVSIFCVGLHFFVHAYKRTVLDQDPNIGAPAYFLYAIIFLYTLYDRGITIIEAAVNDDGDTISRASFATYAPAESGPVAQRSPSSKKVVYFAGLPVFSSPHGAPGNDAKSI